MLRFTKSELTPRERRLQAENRVLRDQLAALTKQLAGLQTANEGAYRELSIATGGPRFDPTQPFGSEPKRTLGTLFLKGGTR